MVDQALGRVLRGEERRSRYEPQRREPWRPAPNGPELRRPEPSGPEPWRSHLTAVCPHLKYPSQVNPLWAYAHSGVLYTGMAHRLTTLALRALGLLTFLQTSHAQGPLDRI